MEPTLFQYIKKYSWREQILLLVFTCISFPFLYASLELPKIIVNKAIAATDFPKSVYGLNFEQVEYLAVLCGIFLLLVGINGGFKYFINVFKGRLGERMLRRLRYQLFTQTLRFPVPHFRRTSQGEIIAMITSEVEMLGGFIGDAVAQPAFQGGTLLTILVFMFAQDVVLGLAAIALYPLQVYLIPKLQRQVNALAKERVRTVRRLSERIGESITCIEEIHANDSSERHRADFSRWVGTIYQIRLKIYRKKFFIKFLNNFMAQLTPFFFYSIGGYLVVRGNLTFGALVAVLSAYKDLSSPWKELLDWYQQKEDTRVKYDQLIEQFQPAGMLPEELQRPADGPVPRLAGRVVVSNLTLEDESGVKTVDLANFSFALGERVALLGDAGSGADVLAQMLARIILPTSGVICIGDDNLAALPESVTGRRIAYVGQHVALVNGTLRDNLLYAVRHQPVTRADASAGSLRAESMYEARCTGNTESDLDDEWIDYKDIGVETASTFSLGVNQLLVFVGVEPDVLAFGLRSSANLGQRAELARHILEARLRLRQRLKERRYAGLIEVFDRDRYNQNMTVAENLMFGLPIGPTFNLDHLSDHPFVRDIFDRVDLRDEFFAMGVRVAKIMLDLFRDLPPGHDFFERFSFISAENLAAYEAAVRRVESAGFAAAAEDDRNILSSLPFRLIPARHRLGLLDDSIERRLLKARHAFAEELPDNLRSAVAFFDPDAYNPAASVQDNILFGKVVYGRQQAQREVGALIGEIVDELDLRAAIVDLGLDFEVGIGGGRLSAAQRQKFAIARALLKRPDLFVFDNATTVIDAASQAEILTKLLQYQTNAGIVWVTSDENEAEAFDRVILMEGGRVVGQGGRHDAARKANEREMAPAADEGEEAHACTTSKP
ncbi:MAG: ABC transporter ATP-binding protein [Rhodospirillales bacterium]|nr:ABC transporter ATP-binding protein [Rhodospirillales bacterium]